MRVILTVLALALTTTALADVDARLAETGKAIEVALAASPAPGLVIGITDREKLRKVIVHGYADLKTRTPMRADSRLAIGSISKAFTSIALLQLADEHRFDVKAPITRYLPWLDIHSSYAAMTGRDLMSHTAGLPYYLADSASSRFAGLELKDFEPTYAPGAHWQYSNTSYQLLGYALESIVHGPLSSIIRRRVLEPLGMSSSSAIIDDAERTRMVVSYVRWPYDGRYVEAPWVEYTAGDGSIVSTVVEVSHGADWHVNRDFAGPVTATGNYAAYVGHYVYPGPEGPEGRVYIRNGELVGVFGWDEQLFVEKFSPLGSGTFVMGEEPHSPERAHFDSIVDGYAQRLIISGVPLCRRETP
ncbi:MAG: beta-lactamase family protein [Proteobacteria bacterium]|nr:beta-lactamase family protein [Pseudomonadota bacterium]